MERKSNLELLRIVAMLMIISLHYFAFCNAGTELAQGTKNDLFFRIVESFSICGVNIFVLISGWFSLKQTQIKERKIVNLLVDIAFWGALGYIFSCIMGWRIFDIKGFIKVIVPFITGGRWFVKAYIILLLFSPFINRILLALSKEGYKKLLVVSTVLFSLWPSFFPYPPLDDYGYGFVHFIYLYMIAGYLKLHISKLPEKKYCLLGYVVSGLLVVASSLLNWGYAWAYNYIFVVLEAVLLFAVFVQLKIQSRMINVLASCAFGVFLIHTDGFFSVVVYDKLFQASKVIHGSIGILFWDFILCIPVFYLISFIMEFTKQKMFIVTITKILNKIPCLNYVINIE